MPGKGRRVAARQGELSRKKRKQQRGPSGVPTATGAADGAAESSPQGGGGVATQTRPATASRPAVSAPRSGSNFRRNVSPRVRPDNLLLYQYIGAELRRIAIFAGVAIIVLVVLTFVLR